MTLTLANGYSSESAQRELSNEYQHDRVSMIFKDFCVLVLSTNVGSALEGLNSWLISLQPFQAFCTQVTSFGNISTNIISKSELFIRYLQKTSGYTLKSRVISKMYF